MPDHEAAATALPRHRWTSEQGCLITGSMLTDCFVIGRDSAAESTDRPTTQSIARLYSRSNPGLQYLLLLDVDLSKLISRFRRQ